MPVRVASSYSDRVPALLQPTATALALAALFAAEPAAPRPVPPGAVPLRTGRTTTVRLAPDLGTSVERAVPGRAFARAVDMDAEQRWAEAAALYQSAVAEWTDAERARPSPALERAIQKAERERQRSTLLGSTRPARGRFEALRVQINPLEEGRLLRAKVMVVRAARGLAPPELVARARAAFEEASRAAAAPRTPFEAEIRLQLCATRAAGGDRDGARLERAHITSAERRDLENALPLALCAAALGEDDEALALLEMYMLRPLPHPMDPYTLRDLYLANDWDRLRGKPRFESLFRSSLPALPP
jgi:TPR repeat protein